MTSLPSTETYQDLSAVADMTDSELTAALGVAQARFAVVRANDPRRTSLAYSDAKLALDTISREHRARLNAARIAQHQIASVARVVPMPRRGDVEAARAAASARTPRVLAQLGAALGDENPF